MKEHLLTQLKHAEASHGQFHFCHSYYNNSAPDLCSVANQNHLKNKNNYWGLPYDHNLITSIPRYINASPMKFKTHSYIAAQGPRTNTIADFWWMILEENSSLIVSVTNEQEKRATFNGFKFNRFWPDTGSESYDDVTVTLLSCSLLQEWNDGREEKIRERRFHVQKGDKELQVTHLHMENWPDNGVIHPESLISLATHTDNVFTDGPITVHCAAGVGRTGTFIAYHSLLNELQLEPKIDLPARVAEMRKLRWGAVVSAPEQYHLIINALRLALS